MFKSRLLIGALAAAFLLLFSAWAYDRTRSDTIAEGVTIGGIDVSGLQSDDASAKLEAELQETVQQPIRVRYDGRQRTLDPQKSKVRVDVDGMVDEAVQQSNDSVFVVNAVRSAIGSERNIDIPTRITFSEKRVRSFVRSVGRTFNREPIDAKISYSATSIGEVEGKPGLKVRSAELSDEIAERLQAPTESRRIKLPVKETQPKVTKADLKEKYGTILLVSRKGFKIRLYKNLKLKKTYGIALGKAGMDTPSGLYSIANKAENPSWHVPNSAWAGDLAGKVIPPGPDNPIKARWLGIYDGVGIHGTSDVGSIGSNASHGCIRMIPEQVIQLYDQVPVGTPIYIS